MPVADKTISDINRLMFSSFHLFPSLPGRNQRSMDLKKTLLRPSPQWPLSVTHSGGPLTEDQQLTRKALELFPAFVQPSHGPEGRHAVPHKWSYQISSNVLRSMSIFQETWKSWADWFCVLRVCAKRSKNIQMLSIQLNIISIFTTPVTGLLQWP